MRRVLEGSKLIPTKPNEWVIPTRLLRIDQGWIDRLYEYLNQIA